MKAVITILFLAFTASAYAQYGWQKVDTLTTGDFDDYNPQVDHGGLGMWSMWAPFEWIVFERWSGGESSICGMKVQASTGSSASLVEWDQSPMVISSSNVNPIQEKPDICTIFYRDTVTLASWQGNSLSSGKDEHSWSIYYSYTSGNETEWSTPNKLTTDSADEEDVKVRPLTDSSFILIWKTGNVLMFTTFENGIVASPDTLVVTSSDSTEFDCEQFRSSLPTTVWTGKDTEGEEVCFVSEFTSLNPVQISQLDTLSADGNIGDPKFLSLYQEAMTFNVEHGGRINPVVATDESPYQNAPWQQQDLADDSLSDNLNAVGLIPLLVTSASNARKISDAYPPLYGLFGWERISHSDTSLIFFPPDTVLSAGYNRNPAMSTYLMGSLRAELGECVWESDRSGHSHIYGRVAATSGDAIDEPPHHVTTFILQQNYPDPFNPTTTITYQLSTVSNVTLKVYDVWEEWSLLCVNDKQAPGVHSIKFDASRLSSGVYFYRLTSGNSSAVKKLVVMK